MARRVAAWLLGALTLGGLVAAAPAGGAPRAPQHRDEVVLVVHTGRHTGAGIAAASSVARDARTAIGDVVVRHQFPAEHAFSVAVPRPGERAALRRLRALPGVRSVEAPIVRHFFRVPDDPDFAKQARYLQAVRAPRAWDQNQGLPGVTIAVVDSGVDVQHPDLAGKIAGTFDAHTGTSDVTDTVGHGTFVAGVAAAATDNGIGIAGAGYDTRILAVKIADAQGGISIDDEVAGIRWAVNHGANVINLSIGGPDPSALERRAVEYAQAKNVLVVAAAGNTRNAAKQYPAAYPGVLSVGATNPARHARASFSSHGAWVDIAAPGVGIYSTTVPTGTSDFPAATSYGRGDGTSFSAALVSGEAALVDAKNATLSAAQVRSIIVHSAHGFRGLGLGAGQVDFASALAATAPTTAPTALSTAGEHGRVVLRAETAASEVAFRIDGDPALPPVRVSDGAATLRWPSWGYANGPHELRAYNCSSGGACGPHARQTTFTLDNAAPSITAPSRGARRTGRFLVRAESPDGGALRLLVDGRPAAFDSTAPYLLWVNGSALAAGRHLLQVRGCSEDARHCAGPASGTVPVRVTALRPRILALRPRRISPNGDGVQDTAVLRYRTANRARVFVRVLDATGREVRSVALGRLAAGVHTWTWRAPRLPDGTYTVAVAVSRAASGGPLRGWASVRGVVDTRPPRFTRPSGRGGVIFPVRDGFHDRFVTRTQVDEPGTVTMTIRNSRGGQVRQLRRHVAAGPVRLAWNGRSSGRIVAPGRYHWRLSLRDGAGNTSTSHRFVLHVSAKHLVTRRVRIFEPARRSFDFGRTNPQCTAASTAASRYPQGILLTNTCPAKSLDLAYARYRFALPRARTYRRLSFRVIGTAPRRPSELSATVDRTDSRVEVPRFRTVRSPGQQVVTMATVSGAKHVTRRRQVFATVVLDSRYPRPNAFDLRAVALQVVLTRLRR